MTNKFGAITAPSIRKIVNQDISQLMTWQTWVKITLDEFELIHR